MIAGEKLLTDTGVEVLLFPMDCMYITQGEHGSISHVLAMDFVGWNGSMQINNYPYYAPCSVQCIAKNYNNGQAYLIFESINPVYLPNGQTDYVNFVVMHDNNPLYNVGDVINQGDILGHTGDARFCDRGSLTFKCCFR